MTTEVQYLDFRKNLLRKEFFSSEEKALFLISELSREESYIKEIIPKDTEYIVMMTNGLSYTYWIDKRENHWEIKLWSEDDG